MPSPCVFCAVAAGDTDAHRVFEDASTLGFLDHRPLFPGHVLLVPRAHHVLLGELPAELVTPLFENAQMLSLAVKDALEADGTFLAINNGVSQSVPHLHVHVVPRRKGDGLKGFFWPRRGYDSPAHMIEVQERIAQAVRRITPRVPPR